MHPVVLVGWFALALSVCYAVAATLVWAWTGRSEKRLAAVTAEPAPDDALPSVSVIVAARNEEDGLHTCLASLRRIDYPGGLWEAIVVDDRSADGTADVVEEASLGWPGLRLLRVTDLPAHLAGKQHALAVAIEGSKGEIIAMTDADCVVPTNWLRDVVRTFRPDVGAVYGLASFTGPSSSWLERLDMAHLAAVCWGFIELGMPMTAMGNNLALRRSAYEGVGGYRALGYTIAEDCAMVQALARCKGRWRIAVAPPRAAIATRATGSCMAFMRQRARWATGVRNLTPLQSAALVAVFAQRVATVAATAMSVAGLVDWWPTALAWGSWLVGDVLLVWRGARAVGVRSLSPLAPLVTLCQAVYQPIVGLWGLLLPGRVAWKPEERSDGVSG